MQNFFSYSFVYFRSLNFLIRSKSKNSLKVFFSFFFISVIVKIIFSQQFQMKIALLSIIVLLIVSSVAKKGMTWVVTNWPTPDNNWAGSVGCSSTCGAYSGDAQCTDSRPVLCVVNYKSQLRPFYYYQKKTTGGAAFLDGGFYNGWTGGYFAATPATVGTLLTSKAAADKICQKYFGATAQIMQHHLGRYMNYMNDEPLTWSKWNWSLTNGGGWNGWGYFKGQLPCTRMWTWVIGQPANCGV